ncbi:hypothetical protein, partial [Streptomyces bohaiensis]|uniref:hypothetical protein n=1 Tax=Streptomyces bohaiensis TaxID=1431344 RepID=UPI0030C73C87
MGGTHVAVRPVLPRVTAAPRRVAAARVGTRRGPVLRRGPGLRGRRLCGLLRRCPVLRSRRLILRDPTLRRSLRRTVRLLRSGGTVLRLLPVRLLPVRLLLGRHGPRRG